MSLIKFFHSTLKILCLLTFSIAHSFNYHNYICFLILILRDKETIEIALKLYIILYFIIYEIIRYFASNITNKINRFIGDHAYYSLSICILSVINLIFSFISLSYSNIFIFIFYRVFISLFNSIAQYIDLPLSLLYNRKEFPYKKRNFSFLLKINNFTFFLSFLFLYIYLTKFYYYCFFLAFLNLLCFVASLIILGCNKENIYNQYYPSVSERDNNYNGKYLKSYELRAKTNIKNNESKNRSKKNLDNSDNNDIIVNIENNHVNNNNINTSINNTDNLIQSKVQHNLEISKNNNNNSSIIHNNQLKNKIKIEEQINQNEARSNNSQTLRGFLFPFLFLDNNNPNLYPVKYKIVIYLLIVFTGTKTLNFISLFILIYKVNKIKIYSFVDKNNNGLLFSELSNYLKISTINEEYLFLFMCYCFLNIFLYFINMLYTPIAIKKKIINYLFYYLSLALFLISSIFFISYYLKTADNTVNQIETIRKDIILFFLFNFIMHECNMIISIFYNIIGKNRGFREKMLKEIKSLSVFFAGLLFLLIQTLIVIINDKITENKFENYIYYILFSIIIFIILILSILFL